jgi:hypothetical protein
MGKTLNYIGTNIEDAFDYASDGVSDIFDGESTDVDTETDGSLSNITATMDSKGNVKYFDSEGTEIDASSMSDADKKAFMSADDEDYSVFGDLGIPKSSKTKSSKKSFDVKKALGAASKFGAGAPQVIGKSSRLLDVDLPNLRGGRLPMPGQYPYAAPSYLQGSQAYNAQVGKLVNALLREEIRPRSIRTLI